ncbi:MAG TPA: HAMP domain-containing protein, partial [Candidatus Saccharimonadia bacterium]|nr:HAMP domain-containing protein [Candidatus Saccharimonadia bacterium]
MDATTTPVTAPPVASTAPTPAPPPPGRRMPLAWRIFLLFAVLIVLALGTAVFVAYRQGQRIADEAVERALGASVEVQSEFTQRRLEEAQLKSQLIAADPAFVNYVSNAQGGGLGLGDTDVADAGSIVDLLRERQEQYTFDLGVVLDAEGKLLARTDQSEPIESTLGGDPFVAPVLEALTPVSGYWRDGEKLYQAAIMPLDQNEDLVGFLIVALEVNDALGAKIGKVSGADVAYLLPGAEGAPVLVGSSLPEAQASALRDAIVAGAGGFSSALASGTAMPRADFDVGGVRWAGRLAPVDEAGGARLGSTLQMYPVDKATAGYRELSNLVLLVGLVSLLVAIPLSFVIAKATLRPLGNMAKAAHDAAAGNYQTHIALPGNDELSQLSQSFERLLSDLREKRDIEGYVGNLSRFLPDPGQESPVPSFVTRDELPASVALEAIPPQRELLLLLGLDLRQFAKPLDGQSAEAAITALNTRANEAEAIAKRTGGRIVSTAGTRFVLGFSGDERLLGALQTARAALASDTAVAGALIEGEVLTGSVAAGESRAPTAVGPATFQLDRLLGESSGGRLLLPRTLGDAAKTLLGEAQVGVVQGAVSAKPFYSVVAEALAMLPPPPAPPPEDPDVTTQAPSISREAAALAARNAALVPGVRFGGRYEILAVLGEGGMGVVYKARDLELDDVVALKMLKPAALADHEHLERLKSEIKLARKITHPNVLRTFDFGESEGRPYVSMEYVRGMTLRYLLKQAGRIPYSAALRIARQLCGGLAAAHE